MDQREISLATVERLRAERADVTDDPDRAAGLDSQIRLHEGLAGITAEPDGPAIEPAPEDAARTGPSAVKAPKST